MAHQGPQYQGPQYQGPPYQGTRHTYVSIPVCPNGHSVPAGAQFCPACSLPVGALVCGRGHTVAPGQRFCPQCGAPAAPWRDSLTGGGCVRPYGDQLSDWWAGSGSGANRRLIGPSPAELLTWSRNARWRRVCAFVIDYVLGWVLFAIAVLGVIVYLAACFVNAYFEGTTGQTLGKKAVGIYTIRKDTGEFIGGAVGIGRQLLHILDFLLLFTGYIIGLITNRTYADMIIGTVVVRRPRSVPAFPSTPAVPPPPSQPYGAPAPPWGPEGQPGRSALFAAGALAL